MHSSHCYQCGRCFASSIISQKSLSLMKSRRYLKSLSLHLCILASVFWVPASWSASLFSERYDHQIEQAAERYLPGYDWRLWKAQLYQESRLESDAVSPVGARGLAQFMPATWAEVTAQLKMGDVSPHAAKPAIIAGAYYQGRMIRIWRSPRPAADRYSLGAASYNAGAGNIIKSQKECDGKLLYSEIIECLPHVTGRHADETTTYVERIWRYYAQLLSR